MRVIRGPAAPKGTRVAVACGEGVQVGVVVRVGVCVGISVGVGVDVAAIAVGVCEATGAGVSNVAVAAAMTDDAGGSAIECGQVVTTSQAPIPIKIRPASCLMRQRTIYPVCPLERTNTNAAPPAIKIRPATHNSQLPFDAAVSRVGGNVDSGTGVSEASSANA
jgi:hypothetical protein